MRDLSLHILDLIQNGAEAGGLNITLSVDENLDKDFLTIVVSDDGKGMTPDFVARVRDPFTTSRTVRKVGLGLPLIDMTTKMAGGRLDICSEPGKGTKVTAVYRHSHIDRPPLGDIASTVKIIVVSYQKVFFRYEHRVKKGGIERVFLLDTREIREILGREVDFGDYLVREWLDEYLKDGLNALKFTEG